MFARVRVVQTHGPGHDQTNASGAPQNAGDSIGSGSSEAIASGGFIGIRLTIRTPFCQTYGTESAWYEGNRNVIVVVAFMADTPAVPDSSKQLIDMLRRSRLFRDYERVFSEATGLALAIRPLEFWQLAHHGKKHENPFCALLAENPATLSVCLRAHQDMIDHTGVLPHTVTCPFGLTETAVPIKLGEQIVGYLRIGQVLRHMPAKTDTTRVSRQLEKCGVRFTGDLRKSLGEKSTAPTREIQCDCAAARIFCRSAFSIEQPIDDGEKQCRAAPCSEGA